jgi:cAMP phosphodiesterase
MEEKMRVQAEHESKLQAEAYAFRSMHQNYFAQIEHYKKAAQQAQSELKCELFMPQYFDI